MGKSTTFMVNILVKMLIKIHNRRDDGYVLF